MKKAGQFASVVFGCLMLILSLLVTVESVLRKLFQFSFGGVDELSGYAIAIAAPLAFVVALVDQAHIRINLFYMRLSLKSKAILDGVSAVSLLLLALFLGYFTLVNVIETKTYSSIAQTPWATPLIYPQFFWAVAMMFFAATALVLGVRALRLLFAGNWKELNRQYGPGSVEDELKAELDDLQRR